MEITKDTKLSDLIAQYPRLWKELPAGKTMMGKASVADMGRRSGMDPEIIIAGIREMIPVNQ